MAVKSTDTDHLERSEVLRTLRLESSYTQLQLARNLGISREKVVAVENCHLASMCSLELDTVKNWWRLCKGRAEDTTRKKFATLMRRELVI